jgi:purine-binding chemotaxis protein CheW
MSKSLAASKHLMQNYLSELLTEEVDEKATVQVKEKLVQPVEQLLSQVSLPSVAGSEGAEKVKADEKAILDTSLLTEPAVISRRISQVEREKTSSRQQKSAAPDKAKSLIKKKAIAPEVTPEITTRKSVGGFEAKPEKSYRQGDFQALFFNVAGLTVAVPLIELGGIHNSDKTTALMGKPEWFKGVMLRRDEKINVVDTARWVMPEKCDEKLLSSLDYQYIIMLNDSSWGLAAESLVNTVTLKQKDVKWLDSPSKRPWLAGLVKDRMCALLDVDSLIKLLEKGVNITQE